MHIIQRASGLIVTTEKGYYNDAEGHRLLVGEILCLDSTIPLLPGSTDFAEYRRGRVFSKPATAFLGNCKHVVAEVPQENGSNSSGDYSGEYRGIIPWQSRVFEIRGKGSFNNGDFVLTTDGQYYAVPGSSSLVHGTAIPRTAVGIALETKDTSAETTGDLILCMGLSL